MNLDPDFIEAQRQKALHKWKWRNPYMAAFLAFIHPLGMLYTSVAAFFVYVGLWLGMVLYWKSRPFGTGIALASIFAFYAYAESKWRNAAIEKWKYGLPGTGTQNPRKLGLE